MLLLRKSRPDLRKVVLAGFLGGLAGAWVMSRFSAAWQRVSHIPDPLQCEPHLMHASPQEWDSTLNTAAVLARVVRHPLRQDQRELAAVAVHYAVGASMGAGYAVLHELIVNNTGRGSVGTGAVFGALLWLSAQEIAMPLLHLSASPRQYPLAAQANSLGEHVAYGITTELVCRAVQEAL